MNDRPASSVTVVPAERAARARMRCGRCFKTAGANGPDMVIERRGGFVTVTHDGECPVPSGWGAGTQEPAHGD